MLSPSRSFVLYFAALLVTSGCGEDEDGTGSLDPSSLNSADFEAAGTTALSPSDLEEEMEDFDAHENDVQSASDVTALALRGVATFGLGGDGSIIPGCSAEGMYLEDSIEAEGGTLRFHLRLDLGECMKQSFQAFMTVDAVSAGADARFEMSCPGADYSALNGKKISDLMSDSSSVDGIDAATLGGCKSQNNTMTRQMKMRIDMSISGHATSSTTGETRSVSVTAVAKMADMSPDGSPCNFVSVGGQVTAGECAHYESSKTVAQAGEADEGSSSSPSSSSEPATNNGFGQGGFGLLAGGEDVKVLKADITNVKGPIGAPYYQSGVIQLSLNDWHGQVTLDGTAHPAWELVNGTQTLSGRVGNRFSTDSVTSPTATTPTTPVVVSDPYLLPSLGLSAESKVYYVGVYEGSPSGVAVHVAVKDHPVVLVLSSYDSTDFTVAVEPDTKVELVVLSGYHPSRLLGLPAGVKVLANSFDYAPDYGDSEPLSATYPHFYAYRDDSETTYNMDYIAGKWQCTAKPDAYQDHYWTRAQGVITKITNKSVAGALGAYTGTSFTVDATTLDAKLDTTRSEGYCYMNADGTLVQHGVYVQP